MNLSPGAPEIDPAQAPGASTTFDADKRVPLATSTDTEPPFDKTLVALPACRDILGSELTSSLSAAISTTLSTAPSSGFMIAPSACPRVGSSSASSFLSIQLLPAGGSFRSPLTPFSVSATCRMPRRLSGTRMPTASASSSRYAGYTPVSYTHLRAHETDSYLVCRLLLEKKK